ncbi:MAG: hypothetical protein ABI743_06590, partial [bacterium]
MKLSISRWLTSALSVTALVVLSALALAEGGPAQLTGVKYLERGEQAELELALEGQTTVEVELLDEGPGFQVTLHETDPVADLALPDLADATALKDLGQSVETVGDDHIVTLTVKLAVDAFSLDQVHLDNNQAGIVRVIWSIPAIAIPDAPAPAPALTDQPDGTDLLSAGDPAPEATPVAMEEPAPAPVADEQPAPMAETAPVAEPIAEPVIDEPAPVADEQPASNSAAMDEAFDAINARRFADN